MSEKVGGVICMKDIIVWRVSSFLILPRTEGSRIWSPEFSYKSTPIVPGCRKIHVPKGSVGLIFYGADIKSPLNKCVIFGVLDKSNNIINCCEAEWIEKHDPYHNGYFRVQDLLKHTEFVNRVRLFCEVISEKNNQTSSIPIKSICGKYLCSELFLKIYSFFKIRIGKSKNLCD